MRVYFIRLPGFLRNMLLKNSTGGQTKEQS